MRYLPHTDEEIAAMLQTAGKPSLDALFDSVPEACRRDNPMDLPDPMTEWEVTDRMSDMASTMAGACDYQVYIGAGSYEHLIPASVNYLLGRSEFSTAYTPYQPEVSQGTLQAVFEYQTYVSRLMGMEVANASMYDGATATAEALLMSIRVTKKKTVAVSKALHPHYRQVVDTYFGPTDYTIVDLPYTSEGRTDLSALTDVENLAGVVVQSPNFFGVIEDLKSWGDRLSGQKAMFITAFTEPMAYGLLKSPGALGADIACGEGQSFGIPQSFGGPGLGMFASRLKFVRNMPGRLVGETKDLDGRRGFVLTLSTREQHIRRERATSNICTNSGLCALTSVMYMASLGGGGIREMAELNRDKAAYLKKELEKAGFSIPFTGPTFNEFVVKCPDGYTNTWKRLFDKKIVAGLPLSSYYPELDGHYLFCVTEVRKKAELDALVREVTS